MALIDRLVAHADVIRQITGLTDRMSFDDMDAALYALGSSTSATPPYTEYSLNQNGEIVSANMVGYSNVPAYFCYYLQTLTSIDFSDSNITSIGAHAFQSCQTLELDSLPDTIVSIGDSAFQYCYKLDLTTLPPQLTEIPQAAFSSCSILTLTEIPDQIVSIGQSGFSLCPLLAWSRLPSNLTNIGRYAFQNCYALQITKIPETVTMVDRYAFQGCTGLINLEIGASTLSYNSFGKCTGLQKVWIRNSCTTISATTASYAPFVDCSAELNIYVEASEAPSGWSAYFSRCGTYGNTTATVIYNQTTCPW